MYQYSGDSGDSYILMHLSINSVAQKHSASLNGDTQYAGNFGLWQGSLNSDAHNATLDYRTPVKIDHTVSSNLEWEKFNKATNRAMTVIIC